MSKPKPSDKHAAILAIRLISAKAAKLADDLEKGQLWSGDYERGLSEIQSALDSAKSA